MSGFPTCDPTDPHSVTVFRASGCNAVYNPYPTNPFVNANLRHDIALVAMAEDCPSTRYHTNCHVDYKCEDQNTVVIDDFSCPLDMTVYTPLFVISMVFVLFLISLCCRRKWYVYNQGRQYRHGLCSCFMCCRGFFCSPCMVGANGDALDGLEAPLDDRDPLCKGCLSRDCALFTIFDICGLGWLIVADQRKRMRKTLGIAGDTADDFANSACCTLCTNCQTSGEIQESLAQQARRAPESAQRRPAERTVLLQPVDASKLNMDV